MPKRRTTPHPQSSRLRSLDVLHPNAAGADIGSDFHVVAVAPPGTDCVEVRSFGACTADLHALADWLKQHRVDTVAMEATGVYWIALYDLLEARGSVFSVDPRQIQRAPGRPKSDTQDAQWIRRLHSLGLLSGAFRPDEGIRVLRSYLRQRAGLVTECGRTIQHMQKALEQINVKLTEAVSDITGKTGLSIIQAILAGERDPTRLKRAAARPPLPAGRRADRAGSARDPEGGAPLRVEAGGRALGVLPPTNQRLQTSRSRRTSRRCRIQTPASRRASTVRRRKRKANGPRFDARREVYRVTKVDLTAIEGIEETTALVLLGEIGTDMSKWPSSKQFCSWLGLCPQVRQSAGKVLSSKVRAGPNRAAQALRLAANTLQSSKSRPGFILPADRGAVGEGQGGDGHGRTNCRGWCTRC